MIRAIVHVDRNWGIGKGNNLMFSIPKDMKFFRSTTLGKTVVMGGNTLLSFPGGKPLKNRTNVVLTSRQVSEDYIVARTMDELKNILRERKDEDIYIIGGGSIYKAMLPYCEEVLVTKVDADGGAEVFFPDLDKDPDFVCVDSGTPLEDNGYTIYFTTYKNNKPAEI